MIEQFERDGILVLRSYLPPTLASDWRTIAGQCARADRFVTGYTGPLGELWLHPVLLGLALAIIGAEPALFINRILLKDDAWNQDIAVHQDLPYFDRPEENKLSVFVPLAPCDALNGGLFFVIGSHKHGALERGAIKREMFPVMQSTCPELAVGDIVLMDFLTWHYSLKARVRAERPLMQIVYRANGTPRGSHLAPLVQCSVPDCVLPDRTE